MIDTTEAEATSDPFTTTITVVTVDSMTPANTLRNQDIAVEMVVSAVTISDLANVWLLVSINDSTEIAFINGAFAGGYTGAAVEDAGVHTFTFTRDVDFAYEDVVELAFYDIGTQFGYSLFYVERDPEVVAGWLVETEVESHFQTALTQFTYGERVRQAMLRACEPSRAEIQTKRLSQFLHMTPIGGFFRERFTSVPYVQIGLYKTSSNDTVTVYTALVKQLPNIDRFVNELRLAGVNNDLLNWLSDIIHGNNKLWALSAVSGLLHLAIIVEQNLK